MTRGHMLFPAILLVTAETVLAAVAEEQAFSYEDYGAVLKDHVNDAGMVNYKELRARREELETFLAAAGKLDPNTYHKWNNEEKIAFWVNAYNACTLKAIVDNYPIKSSFLRSMYYPRNSIRQIRGVWDKITFNVIGKDYTLEHIEHQILRKQFSEPRIHMALVCAAMGCPPLRNEPYIGETLNEQLDDQSRKFLANPTKFTFDPNTRLLHISPIFKWFSEDFAKATVKKEPFMQYSNEEAAMLEFVSKYLDKNHAFFAPSRKDVDIKYHDYDWSLNEQQNGKSKEPKK